MLLYLIVLVVKGNKFEGKIKCAFECASPKNKWIKRHQLKKLKSSFSSSRFNYPQDSASAMTLFHSPLPLNSSWAFLPSPQFWDALSINCCYFGMLQASFEWKWGKCAYKSNRKNVFSSHWKSRTLALFEMQMSREWLSQKQNYGWWSCINLHACILEREKSPGNAIE